MRETTLISRRFLVISRLLESCNVVGGADGTTTTLTGYRSHKTKRGRQLDASDLFSIYRTWVTAPSATHCLICANAVSISGKCGTVQPPYCFCFSASTMSWTAFPLPTNTGISLGSEL